MIWTKNSNTGKASKLVCVNLIVTLIALAMLPVTARASVIAFESFDYLDNKKLRNRQGGAGDWKDKWPDDNNLIFVAPGTLTYTDSQSNTLNTSGGHVRNPLNSFKMGYRDLDGTYGAATAPPFGWAYSSKAPLTTNGPTSA